VSLGADNVEEGRGYKAEGRRQKAEGRGQKAVQMKIFFTIKDENTYSLSPKP